MSEYYNLINRMREGVLILSRDNLLAVGEQLKIQFFNKSAEKLIVE